VLSAGAVRLINFADRLRNMVIQPHTMAFVFHVIWSLLQLVIFLRTGAYI